jgi:hypothetical protein
MKYKHHSFLDAVYVDFVGLTFLSGGEIFYRFADWVEKRNCEHLIPAWQIEAAALLYHVVFGIEEKLKTVPSGEERAIWQKIQKNYTKLGFNVWRFIWQVVAENSLIRCGESPADAICGIFGEYEKAVLVCEKRKSKKHKFDFELDEIPNLRDE